MKRWFIAGVAVLLSGCNPLPDVDVPEQTPGEEVTYPTFVPRQQIALTTTADYSEGEETEEQVEARATDLRARAEQLREASTE